METAVVVALISSAASLTVAVVSAGWSARQGRKTRDLQSVLADRQATAHSDLEQFRHELRQQERHQDRVIAAEEQLDRYREPLLLAVHDLGERLDNIRHQYLLAYLNVQGHRREMTILSTLFRFARYFARLEMLYADIGMLRFASDVHTKDVADRMAHVGRTLADDSLGNFMLWREEQRAVGELMCRLPGPGDARCAGYSLFVEQYDEHFRRWLSGFAADLCSRDAAASARLEVLQLALAQLMISLDQQSLLVAKAPDSRVVEPRWVARFPGPALEQVPR